MARFRYALQVALDDARAREHDALTVLARERAEESREAAALRALRGQAAFIRAGLARQGSGKASIYVEAGLRLVALAAAERERCDRLGAAKRASSDAALVANRLGAHRRAIENDRDTKRERWLAAEALREAAVFDEANAARSRDVHISATSP